MANWTQDIEVIKNGCKKENCNGNLHRTWDIKLDEDGNEITRYDDGTKCQKCGEWQ
jgi:hypothetical protein